MERSYTVKEIDDLRTVIANKIRFGRYDGTPPNGYMWMTIGNPQIDYVLLEERIRTHMLAGHTAQDLLNSESPTNERKDSIPG